MNTHPIDSNPASYVPTVLALYLSLPDMPRRRSRGCGKVESFAFTEESNDDVPRAARAGAKTSPSSSLFPQYKVCS